MSEFHLYLISKKIDPSTFEKGNTALYREFETVFAHIHPASFTAQKLFLLNIDRLKELIL